MRPERTLFAAGSIPADINGQIQMQARLEYGNYESSFIAGAVAGWLGALEPAWPNGMDRLAGIRGYDFGSRLRSDYDFERRHGFPKLDIVTFANDLLGGGIQRGDAA